MSVLVAYATKYGSTKGVAERVAETLKAAGLGVELQPIEQAHDVTGFDAFVIGSAVYAFHWLKPAVRFVEQNQGRLAACPVWLFSVGPLGPKTGPPPKAAHEVEHISGIVGARGHAIFYGALDVSMLRGADRLSGQFMKSFNGDWRDWQEIEAWAAKIAQDLVHPVAAAVREEPEVQVPARAQERLPFGVGPYRHRRS